MIGSKSLPVNKIQNAAKTWNLADYCVDTPHDILEMILKRNSNKTEIRLFQMLYARGRKLQKKETYSREKLLHEFGHNHDKQRKSQLP